MGTLAGEEHGMRDAGGKVGPRVESEGDFMQVDDRGWPRVRCVVADVEVSDEALLRSVKVLGDIARRGERYTLLIDGRHARPLGARQRKLLADAALPTAAAAARNCAGSAIVVSNAVLAGIVTALQWIKPSGYPERAFSSFEDAEAWLEVHRRAGRP